MGMPVRIRLYCPTDEAARMAASAAFARVAALDQTMSDYRSDSELSRLGTVGGTWSNRQPRTLRGARTRRRGRACDRWRLRPDRRSRGRHLARRAQEPAHARRACPDIGQAARRLATPTPRRVAPRGPARRAGHASGSWRHSEGVHSPAGTPLDGNARRHARPRRGWWRHRCRRRSARPRRLAHRRGWCRCPVRRARSTADERGARDVGTLRAIRRDRRRTDTRTSSIRERAWV